MSDDKPINHARVSKHALTLATTALRQLQGARNNLYNAGLRSVHDVFDDPSDYDAERLGDGIIDALDVAIFNLEATGVVKAHADLMAQRAPKAAGKVAPAAPVASAAEAPAAKGDARKTLKDRAVAKLWRLGF